MQTVYPATLSWRDFSTYSRHIISNYWRDYGHNHATPVREEKSERRQYTDADQLAVLLQACEGFQGSELWGRIYFASALENLGSD